MQHLTIDCILLIPLLMRSANHRRSTVSVSRSQDGVKTFAPAPQWTASNLSYEAEGRTLLSDDTLVVGFHDHNRQGNTERLLRPRVWLLRSTDQGRTFSEPFSFLNHVKDTAVGPPWLRTLAIVSSGFV